MHFGPNPRARPSGPPESPPSPHRPVSRSPRRAAARWWASSVVFTVGKYAASKLARNFREWVDSRPARGRAPVPPPSRGTRTTRESRGGRPTLTSNRTRSRRGACASSLGPTSSSRLGGLHLEREVRDHGGAQSTHHAVPWVQLAAHWECFFEDQHQFTAPV